LSGVVHAPRLWLQCWRVKMNVAGE
jgi:hypothetical protein